MMTSSGVERTVIYLNYRYLLNVTHASRCTHQDDIIASPSSSSPYASRLIASVCYANSIVLNKLWEVYASEMARAGKCSPREAAIFFIRHDIALTGKSCNEYAPYIHVSLGRID
jgi:hypothetical protein